MNNNCPICKSKINRTGYTLFCKCGWSKSTNQHIQKHIQKKVVHSIFIAGLIFMGSFIHIENWGVNSIRIVPLKIQQWTNQLDRGSFMTLKKICWDLKKYNCVEQTYNSFFKSSGDLETLAALGEIQYKRSKWNAAAKSYHQYFSQKGKNAQATYYYAHILEKNGHIKMALRYYESALMIKSKVVPLKIMKDYVNLLVKSGQIKKAKKTINKFKLIIKKSNVLAGNRQKHNFVISKSKKQTL